MSESAERDAVLWTEAVGAWKWHTCHFCHLCGGKVGETCKPWVCRFVGRWQMADGKKMARLDTKRMDGWDGRDGWQMLVQFTRLARPTSATTPPRPQNKVAPPCPPLEPPSLPGHGTVLRRRQAANQELILVCQALGLLSCPHRFCAYRIRFVPWTGLLSGSEPRGRARRGAFRPPTLN